MNDRTARRLWGVVALVLAFGAARAAAPPVDSVGAARAVLSRHCATCHDHGQAKGGLGSVGDLASLVDRGQVVPGRPDDSPLFRRVADGEMPPPHRRRTFAPRDVDRLRAWIAAGAPTGAPVASRLVAESELLMRAWADLQALPRRDRRFTRYLSLAPLAARPAGERRALTDAVTKLVNSLSWHPRLVALRPIGGDGLLLRVDLRHYRWTARAWDRLVTRYPYRPAEPTATARELASLTGCDQPCVRADWFVATASRTPLYHEFLQLPLTDRALERQLQVDVPQDLEDGTVFRAGFNGSGVARFNRVLERHDAAHGAYWRSYDFADGTGRGNVFDRPAGPMPGPAGFRHDGGEIIFHLPNGLQGYLLVDADGRRIDRGPSEIVSDPRRPDRLVENGLSCLGCHAQGIIPKDDQVRAHVLKSAAAFAPADRDTTLSLYPPAAQLRRLVREDNDRFAAALRRLGLTPGELEPIITAVLRYEEVVGLTRAAEELGTTTDELSARLRKETDLARTLGPLLARGTVQRVVFEETYPRLLALAPAPAPATPPTAFRLARGSVHVFAWAVDGKRFATASDDGALHVWDAARGISRLVGRHPAAVRALAFTPDGGRLISAGGDRVALVWDLKKESKPIRLVGHTGGLRAVVVSRDGRHIVTGGEDRAVRVWTLTDGAEARAWTAHDGPITALAVSSDGKWLLTGSTDRTAVVWDLATGKVVARYTLAGEIHAVAFAPDGKRMVVGGTGGHLAEWPLDGGTVRRPIERQRGGTVIAAVYSGDGTAVFAVTADRDGVTLACHALTTTRPPQVQTQTPAGAVGLCRDGRCLIADGGTIRVIRLVPGAAPERR